MDSAVHAHILFWIKLKFKSYIEKKFCLDITIEIIYLKNYDKKEKNLNLNYT